MHRPSQSSAFFATIFLFGFLANGSLPAYAQSKPPTPPPATPPTPALPPAGSPYEQLIKGAGKRGGLFTVYQKKDKWYLEIPKSTLDRDMLWYVEAARVPAEFPEGTGEELAASLVKWSRIGDKIYISGYDTAVKKRGGETDPATETRGESGALSLEESGEPTTMLAFPVVAESPSGDAAVVDVSGAFISEIADLKISEILKKGGLPGGVVDPQRSYVRYLKAFPGNVEASAHVTYNVPGKGSASFVIHHSLTLLPDTPMKPRFFDDRVGYFTTEFQDYSGENTVGIEPRAYISRYRLEKKDPNAPLSEPVKPIVYYISREVPDKWRPYFKQAVEDWNVAFEAAGFKNAILAKDPPSREEDPDWSPSDTRYSVIRWISTPFANAQGPHLQDPRSGEILSAHVLIYANVVSLVQKWYYTMCAGSDPRARTIPMPDALVGRLLRYAIAHEVGHSLGLRHNHRASTAYTVKQLRDKTFTATNGSTASIMAYGRFNYVAQPQDGLAPESLIPRVGPYDTYAIAWGYTPIPEAKAAKDEWTTLDSWAAKAVTNPWLLWGGDIIIDSRIFFDPRVQMQNIGVERVEATRLGMLNLERSLSYLPAATQKKGGDFRYTQEFYEAIMGAWLDMTSSVVKEIAGLEETRTFAGRGSQYKRVGRARQKVALDFLLQNALRPPSVYMSASLYADIQPYGLADAVITRQATLLDSLLAPNVAGIMYDAALLNEPNRYSYIEYLSDLTNGVFEEIQTVSPKVDPLRRSLQRTFLLTLSARMAQPPGYEKNTPFFKLLEYPNYVATAKDVYLTDYRASARLVLQQLAARLKRAEAATKDQETQAHFIECQALTQRALQAGETPGKP